MEYIKLSNEINEKINKEIARCTSCRTCMTNCPMLMNYCDSPKDFLNIEKIKTDIPYSCSLCDYCKHVCPKSIDLKSIFLDLRVHTLKESNFIFKTVKTTSVSFHQKNSFSKVFSTEVKETNTKVKKKKRVFFPGCSLSSYSHDIVMKTHDYINKEGDIDIILKCCGNPTHSIGDKIKFKNYYSDLQSDFDLLEVDEVIVACQNCYMTIKRNSKNIKVKSLYEEIAEIGVKKDFSDCNKTFAVHDPCPTRTESHIHDSVRKITSQLGLNIEELKYSKDKTLCCGSGGMLAITSKEIAINQMKKRANQASSEYILSYCEECVESMIRGNKKSIHILDLLFNENIEKQDFTQKTLNIVDKWSNRYKAKKSIDRYREERYESS